eukprot:42190-Rhodomonas_salina.2
MRQRKPTAAGIEKADQAAKRETPEGEDGSSTSAQASLRSKPAKKIQKATVRPAPWYPTNPDGSVTYAYSK